MLLHWLQKTGHKPITLMGGGTTQVGDPSGKDESRKLLDDATIAENLAGIRNVFDKFLTFGNGAARRADGRQRRLARRNSTTSTSCATSAGTSPSTAC